MSEIEKPWAQLVSTTESDSDPVEINKNKFIVGRSKAADLCLLGNKLVSGSHCFIQRKDDGSVWLQDTSTNGTLLNLTQKVIGKQVRLTHGDEIHIVYRKSEPSLNVAYLFQDLEKLRAEEDEENSSECTQLYSHTDELDTTCTTGTAEADSSPVREVDVTNKRKIECCTEPSDEMPVAKKSKVSAEKSPNPDESKNNTSAPEQNPCDELPPTCSDTKGTEPSDNTKNLSDEKHSEPEKTTDVKSAEPNKGPEPAKVKSCEGTKLKPATDEEDAFEESLVCIICQEILHDCVSCQPCMHSFCAGCYSDWMSRSHECPSCRGNVERVNKNYIVNNLIEAYLKLHPEKKRPEEELKVLDARSKILKDTVKPPKLKKTMSELIDEADDDDIDDDDVSLSNSDDDAEADTGDGGIAPPPFTTGMAVPAGFGFGAVTSFIPYKPPKTVCRECPEYSAPVVKGTIATATALVSNIANKVVDFVKGKPGDTPGASTSTGADAEEGPSTSKAESGSANSIPPPPQYKCKPTQVHILCQCCLQPMPDRRTDSNTDKTVPKQQCSLCYRLYCHLYWGCTNVNCSGCIGKFKDMKFTKQSLGTLILQNNYESDVFRNFIESQGKTMDDVIQDCMTQLDAGAFTCIDQPRGLNANSTLCYSCALRNLRDLAYQYRKAIPKDELPAAVTARPDCYWGDNCRTQRTKAHHAANFNHICKQTR